MARKHFPGPQYGGLSIETIGVHADQQRTVLAEVVDYDLAEELACRGYDVRLKVPADREIESRRRRKSKVAP